MTVVYTISNRMAEANNMKDFKASPALGKDLLSLNWKKEIKIWEAFMSVSEEICVPAIFMTLTGEAREAILDNAHHISSNNCWGHLLNWGTVRCSTF